jgi:hypothetical protein
MNMKREIALTSFALLVSVLLSSPTFAQTPRPSANAAPAPAPIEATAPLNPEELSIDDAILFASTPEERAAIIRRCAGPPPKFVTPLSAKVPSSEPAVIEQ